MTELFKKRVGHVVACGVWVTILIVAAAIVNAQQIGSSGLRPFVIAVVPVVGPGGAVGGVAIDAHGVLQRADIDAEQQLSGLRQRAFEHVPDAASRRSTLRKISLRRLEAMIAEHRQQEKMLPQEALYLAGMLRVRHVFLFPEHHDIVIAGEAEGWRVSDAGEVVGTTSGQPVLQLDDLIVALRTAEAAGQGQGISCSIDPTDEGLARYQRLVADRRLRMSPATIELLEQTLGPSVVSVQGVDPETHFAHVLVAADFLMKRLAMGFETPPIANLPSYLELLKTGRRTPRDAVVRFWLTPRYERVLRDPAGLAWELTGRSVAANTETDQAADSAAQPWALSFTARFEELAKRIPAFARLRNCIDLAVVGAILTSQNGPQRTGYEMPLWLDARQLGVRGYGVPKWTASRANAVHRGTQWVVSVSGGVDLDSWAIVESAKEHAELAAVRPRAAPPASTTHWWWD